MKKIIIALLALLFYGCAHHVNECGASTSFYNDCVEYYDSLGIYHKDCPHNNVKNSCQSKSLLENCINCN